MNLTHISLFTGIGGFDLAAEWAGFKSVMFCEIDPFCRAVLRKNFPGVPIVKDVRNVNFTTYTEYFGQYAPQERKSVEEGNDGSTSREKSTSQFKGCDRERWELDRRTTQLTLLTAGVPCQPASTAGKRRGKADDRWLWPEAIRVLSELKPSWAVFENPAGIASLGELGGISEVGSDAYQGISDTEAVELSNICRDIEAHGYEVQPVCIPACAVQAPHRRDRIFIVCHASKLGLYEPHHNAKSSRWLQQEPCQRYRKVEQGTDTHANGRRCAQFDARVRQPSESDSDGCKTDPDTNNSTPSRQRGHGRKILSEPESERFNRNDWSENWVEVASRFCGIYAGFSDWLDKNWRRVNECASKTITRQEVSDLWTHFQSDEVQRSLGGCNPLPTKDNLLTVLCQLKAESEKQDNILFEGKAIQENFMRFMRNNGYLRHSPQGQDYQEQYAGEHTNTMSQLSYEIALATGYLLRWCECETKTPNRVARLKALGNAVVPQQVYPILKAIADIEVN